MAEVIRRVRPTPTDAYLGNPHKGCCTFQRFNGDALFPGASWSEEGPLQFPAAKQSVVHGYLPCTVSYCRWFWKVLEPEKGKYDFSMIDQALAVCKERGQTLAVRLMSFGSIKQPQAPDWYAQRYPMAQNTRYGQQMLIPAHDSPEYLEHWGGLIRAFANRYDGHPLLESIDLAYVGPWGEGDGACSPAQSERFCKLYQDAFKKTPRITQLVDNILLPGIATGAGWRHDCFGSLQAPGSHTVLKPLSYNSTFEDFPRLVQGPVKNAWTYAPVHFETCWVPMYWYRQGFDLDFVLEQGLKYHGTYFMPKSTALPEAWMDKLAAFCRKLGYRYVFRQAMVDCRVPQSGTFNIKMWIENVGVAPIYRRYDFALRLRQGDHAEVITLNDIDIRKWLPGDEWIERGIKLPESIQPGWAELAVGLVDPVSKEARVSFAVKEAFSDRWVDLGGIEVV